MALLEEMMKKKPTLSSRVKDKLRKTIRYTKKSARLVCLIIDMILTIECLACGGT